MAILGWPFFYYSVTFYIVLNYRRNSLQMKNNRSLPVLNTCLLVFCLSFFSFQSKKHETTELLFSDACKFRKIKSLQKSNGSHSGKSVVVDIQNLTTSSLTLRIPAGTIFEPSNEGEQTLLTVKDQIVSVLPKVKTNITIEAYCCQANDASPRETSSFVVNKTTNPKLQKLVDFIKKIDVNYFQNMVWTASDNHSVAAIPNLTPVDKEIRKFLCELTNQKETWYAASQTESLDQNGYIVRNTTEVGGKYRFSCLKNTYIHEEIHKETGGVVMRSQKRRALWDGPVESTFHIRVKGWIKGNYFLKVMDDKNQVLTSYEFEV